MAGLYSLWVYSDRRSCLRNILYTQKRSERRHWTTLWRGINYRAKLLNATQRPANWDRPGSDFEAGLGSVATCILQKTGRGQNSSNIKPVLAHVETRRSCRELTCGSKQKKVQLPCTNIPLSTPDIWHLYSVSFPIPFCCHMPWLVYLRNRWTFSLSYKHKRMAFEFSNVKKRYRSFSVEL